MQSPSLNLPYISPAQAQKHVTHNEALRILDSLVQARILTRDENTPPEIPLEGDSYLTGTNPQDAWYDQANQLAVYQDNGWAFQTPKEGWVMWLVAEAKLIVFNGTEWIDIGISRSEEEPKFGINTNPDDYNRLAVKSESILFSHQDGGNGNTHLSLNKSQTSATASILFQTGFTGCAEIGLIGDQNFRLKVTADGTIWQDAMIIDRQTGEVTFPQTPDFLSTGTEPLNVIMEPDNSQNSAFSMQGAARDNSEDLADGVGLYLTHNSVGNRQFAILSTDSKIGLRITSTNAPILDGYNKGSRADLQIGSNTNGAHVGYTLANTQFSVNNWSGSVTKTVLDVVGALNQTGDLLAVGSGPQTRGDALRVSAEHHTLFGGPAVLKAFSKANLPALAQSGSMVFVTDETGGPVPAFSDGVEWRRFTDRAIVS